MVIFFWNLSFKFSLFYVGQHKQAATNAYFDKWIKTLPNIYIYIYIYHDIPKKGRKKCPWATD